MAPGSSATTPSTRYESARGRLTPHGSRYPPRSAPACRGKAWLHPITTQDAYRLFYQLVLRAGYDVVMPGIAEAQPPIAGIIPAGTPSARAPADPADPADPAKAGALIADGWHRL